MSMLIPSIWQGAGEDEMEDVGSGGTSEAAKLSVGEFG
jgi:hypothetical protein